MKRTSLIFMITLLCASSVYGAYDFTIKDGYHPGFSVDNSETLLMTGGGGGSLGLWDNSFARIEGTTFLEQGFGGIWSLGMGGYSRLEFYGGQVHELSIGSYGTAMLSGGRIDRIHSTQAAYTHAGWPIPHIEMVCDIDSVDHNIATNMLTGNWLDGSAFSIQLVDVEWASPTFENIFFTPEPATLILVVAGMAFLRKRASRIV